MDRALVVVESDDMPLLEEAVELAAGVDAGLVVLSLLTREEYEKDIEVLDAIESVQQASPGDPSEEELATAVGQDLLETVLGETGIDVEVDVVGAVNDRDPAEVILRTAETHDCDHVFLSGRQRSPAGKALFGDRTQSVLLEFDGHVTVALTE